MIERFLKSLVWAVSWMSMALVVGCSGADSEPGMVAYPVTGKVIVDGTPAEYVRVALIPINAKDGRPVASGMTDSEGEFRLKCSKEITVKDKKTIKQFEGAEPGDYFVSLSWLKPIKPESSEPEFGDELLPEKYQNPAQSGLPELKVTIDESETEIPPFQLKRR